MIDGVGLTQIYTSNCKYTPFKRLIYGQFDLLLRQAIRSTIHYLWSPHRFFKFISKSKALKFNVHVKIDSNTVVI